MSNKKQRLGDALVQAGLLTPEQLSGALEFQRTAGQRLGQVLVQQGLVKDLDVARAVADQLRIPFLPEGDLRLDPSVARLVPEAVVRRLLALPVREEQGKLLVGMVDPYNVFALDEIRALVGRPVQPAVLTERALESALRSLYALDEISAVPREAREASASSSAEAAPPADTGAFVLEDQAADAPAVKLVNGILQRALDERASDIHWEPLEDGTRVRYRVDGVLHEVAAPPRSLHAAVVSRLKVMAQLDIAERRLPQDGRFQVRQGTREIDFRVSTLPTVHGEKVAIRLLDRSQGLLQLEQIGFRPETLAAYRGLIRRPYGLVLVTGPTGSGKTTTLMATLAQLNAPEQNIITVEDPVEYHLSGVNQVQVNPRAGLTFANGLRSILRQDPNIIMVGEIRDRETAEIAVRAALTGHLVFSTVHTNDAASTLTRLADMGVEPFLLASAVSGVLAQRLARRLCPHCREPYTLEPGDSARAGLALPGGPVQLHRARGCPHCQGTGYRGRLPLFELMPVTEPIRDLVAKGAPASALAAAARAEGMDTLLHDGLARALAGETSLDEVRRVAFTDTAG
ncbi:MAG: GspE/PulE family protein [Bacillota bacterium]